VTGIATAYMDSVPLVAITGQVPTTLLGNDAFQESDITGITLPITKHSYLVNNAGELGKIVHEAFYIAGSGRMGPVLIDIPKDVQTDVVAEPETVPEKVSIRGYQPTVRGHPRQIAKAASMIAGAARPVIYAGGGVIASGGDAELMQLAETLMIPVTTTLMGLGAIPSRHPLNLGMLGMHGTESANYAITECDLLIAIGARFDDRVTGKLESFAPNAQVIHIDIDPAEIGKNKAVDLPIVGDVWYVLKEINEKLTEHRVQGPWNGRLAEWKKTERATADTDILTPQYVVQTLSDILNGAGIIVTEVGQNQMWAAQHFSFTRPRQWITSGGLGTMGYGFPAAIGASIACPDEPVIDIAGDGSIQMNIQELATVVQYDIPVKIMILNNQYLGMVRQWQELFYDKRYSYTDMPSVDFVGIAKAYGVPGICVTDSSNVKDAIETSLAHDGPFLLDFRIEREENVMPMVPAGAAINEMILGEKR
jgi:acetolactate synthase I/II/III large subunit